MIRNKYIYFFSLILFCTVFSCKSKKAVTNESKKENNKIAVNTEIKFVPRSEELEFKLTKKENMPFSAYDFGAELYNGKIYAFFYDFRRSKSGNEDNNHGDVCVYDIEKDSWSKINVLPQPQRNMTSVILNDKIYLIGSYSKQSRNLIQVYNITKNQWEDSFTVPIGLYWTTAETHNENIYIIGGYCPQLHPETKSLNNVQIYNTRTKTWSEGSKMFKKVQMPNSLKYKDEFYVWSNFPRVMYKYCPKKDSWVSLDKFKPYAKGSQEGVVLDNKLFFISGQTNTGKKSKAIKRIFSYNPKTNEYLESISNLETGRHYNYGAFVYKNKIYLLGGREDQNWEAMNDVVELEMQQWQ